MIATRKPAMSLYVEKEHPDCWVMRDREGRLWVVPPGEDVWAKREPVHPSEQSEREPVPDRFLHARAAYLIGDSSPSMSMSKCISVGED